MANRRENIISLSARLSEMKCLQNLNAKQRQAVEAPKQPMLVLAGPGTGKTRTLIARMLYLIEFYKIAPHKILAVTFTNKAKEEMLGRLQDELGDMANDALIGTFHHYCLDVLRTHHHAANLPKQFSIADEQTQLLALSRASRILDAKSLRNVLTAISSYRVNRSFLNPAFLGIAEKWLAPYEQELRQHHLIDFDQIVLCARSLFENHPEVAEQEQQRFEAILIDEFQDTDPVQYHIIRRLAGQHRNIFAVADDDQSIFAWRGANVENIRRYLKDFDCLDRMVVLDRNYRSAQCIIDLAAQLLLGASLGRKRTPIGESAADVAVRRRTPLPCLSPTIKKNLSFSLREIRKLTGQTHPPAPSLEQRGGDGHSPFSYSDIAILYPNHAIGETLETSLLAANIPCQLVKRLGFFEQQDVRKLLLLFKLLLNPADDVALEQFFELELDNALVFQQIKALRNTCSTFKQTLYAAARREIPGISKGQLRRKISASFGLISNLISYIESNPQTELEELLNTICNLALPAHSLSLHGQAHELCDPFDIPGMPEAVMSIRQVLDKKGRIVVHGSDAELAQACCILLNHAQSEFLLKQEVSQTPFSLFFDAETVHRSAPSAALCLDPDAAETVQEALPEETSIILMTVLPDAACPSSSSAGGLVIETVFFHQRHCFQIAASTLFVGAAEAFSKLRGAGSGDHERRYPQRRDR